MTDIAGLASQVQKSQVSATELVSRSLAKANTVEDLNIFINLRREAALKRAELIDNKIRAGEPVGRLAGIPFAVKDNFLVEGEITTAASYLLSNFKSPYTATSVQRLLDEGAIVIGTTNLDAFAHGTSTENSYFGPTKNPHETTKVPGGSSGGSAAAVSSGVCPFALGTDTGGSIRLPASFCGVVGYKPTYGLLSRYGVVAMASSTDCVGTFARSASDTRFLAEILAGRDEHDGTTIQDDRVNWQPQLPQGLKLGVIKETQQGLDAQVDQAWQSGLKQIASLGFELKEISLSSLEYSLACYYILVSAEVSSNLSRYTGLLYGQKTNGLELDETIVETRSRGFMPENKRRILLGTYVLSQGYYDAYYRQAQRLRTKLIVELEQAFAAVDLLVLPTSPTMPFNLGSKLTDPLQMYLADVLTVSANLAGLPAVSIPLKTSGLPAGLQLMAKQQDDGLMLALAERLIG